MAWRAASRAARKPPIKIAAIEPGSAGRFNLRRYVEIGPDSQCHPGAATPICKVPQLDNRAGTAIAGFLDTGQGEVVGLAIDPIDNRIGSAGQFVVQATLHQSADDGMVGFGA